jgi:transcriptional regulator with XRE-family HTH domain
MEVSMQDQPIGVGARIKRQRERKGWSQRELARRAAVDVSWISRLESGERTGASFAVMTRIAVALDVSLDYLAGRYRNGTGTG